MPRTKSSKSSAVMAEEETDAKPTKGSSTPKKPSNEIDDIFAGKKRKKPEKKMIDKETETSRSVKKKKDTRENNDGRFTDPPLRSREKTDDGFTIYPEEELGINSSNAGNTPLCPFDCDCCF